MRCRVLRNSLVFGKSERCLGAIIGAGAAAAAEIGPIWLINTVIDHATHKCSSGFSVSSLSFAVEVILRYASLLRTNGFVKFKEKPFGLRPQDERVFGENLKETVRLSRDAVRIEGSPLQAKFKGFSKLPHQSLKNQNLKHSLRPHPLHSQFPLRH